jgi:hypothetical protein
MAGAGFLRSLQRSAVSRLRGLIRIEEVWFDGPLPAGTADMVRFRQRPRLPEGCTGETFHTLIIDLRQSEDALWDGVQKDVRYEIRRAERDGVVVELDQQANPAALAALEEAYEGLSRRKSLGTLDKGYLRSLAARNMLSISRARAADGASCSWHVYVVDGQRLRLLHSVSEQRDGHSPAERASIGRANRLHHWQDMMHFRARGFSIYDLGGWYAGSDDEPKLRINRFKEGFGGTHEVSFNALWGLSVKGRAALGLRRALSTLAGRDRLR